MKALIYILTLILCSFFVKGQDTTYYWGNSLSDNNNFNRYSITKKFGKCFTIQNFYLKSGTWIKSNMIDSTCIVNDSLILKFKRFNSKLYDSTKLTVKQQDDIYIIEEFYDNDTLKFKSFSTSNYPFNFKGNAKQFYRNGNLYANYYYNDNQIDSFKIANQDTTFRQLVIQSHNRALLEKNYEIVRAIMTNLSIPSSTESGIVTTFIFGLCFEHGKISRTELIRRTDFELDNELIKAIEKIDFSKILDSNVSGCLTIPLRVDYQ